MIEEKYLNVQNKFIKEELEVKSFVMKIVVATIKKWNIQNAYIFKEKNQVNHDIIICSSPDEFTNINLDEFQPDYIFFPHWSYLISNDIVKKYKCIIFHMTDLPYGRGGSPLQNLIVRGHSTTKISAIKATEELDAGPIYLKENLSLEGTAQEIYERASKIIFEEMIPKFLKNKMYYSEQMGEIVTFTRRKPEDGMLMPDMELSQLYDYIRMLDAESYPRAYIEFGDYRLEFEDAKLLENDVKLEAKVIFKRNIKE